MLILDTANTYTGTTAVSEGTLRVSDGGALGGTTAGTTVAAAATLELTGGITVTGEALTLDGNGVGGNGALLNSSGNNTYAGAITLGSASRIQSDAGLLTLDVASGDAIAGAGSNVTFGGAGNITVADAIATGAGTLTKEGAGVLVLAGSNSYAGTTSVTEGTLIVNGNQAAANGNVSVAAGSTLGGAGTIGGATVVSGNLRTGTDIAAGTVGTLGFNSAAVTLDATSTWFVDLVQGASSTTSDSLASIGSLTIQSGALLNFNALSTYTGTEKFTIATYTSLTGFFDAYTDDTIYTIGGGDYIFNYNDGNAITLTSVPEPGTLGLLGLALGGFFVRRWRRRRVAVSESRES